MKPVFRYLLVLSLILILWNNIVVKPLKIFALFLHELGHALTALVFGYGVKSFDIFFNKSGLSLLNNKGWLSTVLIVNGGYLGSILFAILILYLRRTALKKYVPGFLALLLLGVSLKYSGMAFSPTLLYSIIFAAFILLVYMLNSEAIHEWVIDIMGVSAAAYVIYDTFVDTLLYIINSELHIISNWGAQGMVSDAGRLAEMTGVPAIVWGLAWLAIAIAAVNMVFIKTHPGSRTKKNSNTTTKFFRPKTQASRRKSR